MSEDTERLVRLETKMDLILTQLPDHETRIRVLESWRMKVIGWSIGVGGPAGALAAVIVQVASR